MASKKSTVIAYNRRQEMCEKRCRAYTTHAFTLLIGKSKMCYNHEKNLANVIPGIKNP